MTLLLGLSNDRQVLLASDMRMSWNGKILDEDALKEGFFPTSDGRVLYAFTGLASWSLGDKEAFNTLNWLSELIYAASASSLTCREALSEIKLGAQKKFADLRSVVAIPCEHLQLTILFAGYIKSQLTQASFLALITNDAAIKGEPANAEDFSLVWIDEGIKLCGADKGVSEEDKAELFQMLEGERPIESVRAKIAHIFSESSIPTAPEMSWAQT